MRVRRALGSLATRTWKILRLGLHRNCWGAALCCPRSDQPTAWYHHRSQGRADRRPNRPTKRLPRRWRWLRWHYRKSVAIARFLRNFSNPTYETANGVMLLDLYRVNAGGALTYLATDPTYASPLATPASVSLTAMRPNGEPLTDRQVAVRAVPLRGKWPASRPYPAVGYGLTDRRGHIRASLDLVHIAKNSEFVGPSRTIRLDIDYLDSSGGEMVSARTQVGVTPTGDPIVAPPGTTMTSQDNVIERAQVRGARSAGVGAEASVARVTLASAGGGAGGTAAEYIGSAPDASTIQPGEITDVTQLPYGNQEVVGCLYSTFSTSTNTWSCDWTNKPTNTQPYVDTAVTGGLSSAVTINLPWSAIEDLGNSIDTSSSSSSYPALANEINAVTNAGVGVVLVPIFQWEGSECGSNCGESAVTATSNGTSQGNQYTLYTLASGSRYPPLVGPAAARSGLTRAGVVTRRPASSSAQTVWVRTAIRAQAVKLA